MELFKPFRIVNRSLEDILYPKGTYSNKKPLPTLQKTEKSIEQESLILRGKASHFSKNMKRREDDVSFGLENDLSQSPFQDVGEDTPKKKE